MTWHLTVLSADRLGTIVDTADYKYDPFGRRIAKDVNDQAEKYFYDNEDIRLGYDGANQLVASYTHLIYCCALIVHYTRYNKG